jgi:GT2 family glycosyltransferase
MTLTLSIPFMNHLADTKGIMGLLRANTSNTTEWMIVDNGSTDPVEDFFTHTLRPKRLNYLKNNQNIGMVKTYQQIFDAVETDLVAILHNDVYIYEPNWDMRVVNAFTNDPQLGCLGFFGAQGVGTIGERIQDPRFPGQMAGISNMLEAEVHGARLSQDFSPAAILDGFAMVFRMDMIKKAGGLDQRYQFHHLYDRELPLMSLHLGYRNIVLNVPCHHVSGTTANHSEYQTWISAQLPQKAQADSWTHDENSRLFSQKWAGSLPLYVEDNFSFRQGKVGRWHFQGDRILHQKISTTK